MFRQMSVILCSAVIVAFCASIVSCSRLQSLAGPTTVRGKNGHSEVKMPDGWSIATDFNEDADLQIHNSRTDISFTMRW